MAKVEQGSPTGRRMTSAITPRLVSEEEAKGCVQVGISPSEMPARVPEHVREPVGVELRALAERVAAATGPDRALDVLLKNLTGSKYSEGDANHMARPMEANPTGYDEDRYTTTGADEWGIPAYTASLDAALALVERIAPTMEFDLQHRVGRTDVQWYDASSAVWRVTKGATRALALLSALLAALANRPEKPE